MEESIKTLTDAAKKDDLEDAAKKAAEIVPIVSQGIDLAEKYAVGGEVDVPRAAPEPDERIDKMTGLPYNIQAGIPFRDEEDPIKRLGLAGGGMSTDPMQRLGFVVGGLTPIIKGLLKGTDEAVGAFESTAAKNLANATPDGSVDDVAKSLDKNLTDAGTVIKPLDDIPPNESVPNIVKNLDNAIKQYENELNETLKTRGSVDIERINEKYKKYFDEIKKRKLLDKLKRAERTEKYGDKVTSIIEFFEENPKKSAAVAAGLSTAFANRVEPNYADE